MIVRGILNIWNLSLGLEIHSQIYSCNKLFSPSFISFNKILNSAVSYLDIACPGVLPVFSQSSLEITLKLSISLNSNISQIFMFDRKNYFYYDLPPGYQISQFFYPISILGNIYTYIDNYRFNNIIINSTQIEQDTSQLYDKKYNLSLSNFNRCGVSLIEIITNPSFKSHLQIECFLKKIKNILSYFGLCSFNLESGAIRCDINVSSSIITSNNLGLKIELKNLNSLKVINKALIFEVARQVKNYESSVKFSVDTRCFNIKNNFTYFARKKIFFDFYAYHTDSNLLYFKFSNNFIFFFKHFLMYFPYLEPITFSTNFFLINYSITSSLFINIIFYFFTSLSSYFDSFFLNYFFFLYFFLIPKARLIELDDFLLNSKNFYFLLKFSNGKNNFNFRYRELLNLILITNTNIFRILRISLLNNVFKNKLIFSLVNRIVNFNLLYLIQFKIKKNITSNIFIQKISNITINDIVPISFLTQLILSLFYYFL